MSCRHASRQARWFQSAPKKDDPSQLSSRDDLQPVFVVEDEDMRRFVSALDAQTNPLASRCGEDIEGYPKYKVTATMVGRVDYSRDGGFGNLGAWSVRFLLVSVKDVAAKELSYDDLKCPATTTTRPQELEPPAK